MFYPERIKNISPNDLVLEVGPGANPFRKSDILLEKKFSDEIEARSQRADKGKIKTNKQIVLFDGEKFPFKDKTFDYIICSHVLEHVDNVESFVSEITRVGKKGYLEYPTIYYDYIYNFNIHKSFLLFRDCILFWMPKSESSLNDFVCVQKLFYMANKAGKKNIIKELKKYFFQGFEWDKKVETKKSNELSEVVFTESEIKFKVSFVQNLKNLKAKIF
jgi:ubiquinone/menaquinone biosynthesis C-methylase UbiE